MFQNAAIDIAIGLVLMYLVFSLVCTVINEFVATKLDLRSQSVAAGLRELLDDPVVRNTFRRSVATWFDDSMERLSGAYKRHLKFISIIVGCAVAVIINADTFELGKTLWSDSALRAQMVQAADATAAARPATQSAGQPTQPADIVNAFKTANEKLRPLPITLFRNEAFLLDFALRVRDSPPASVYN